MEDDNNAREELLAQINEKHNKIADANKQTQITLTQHRMSLLD